MKELNYNIEELKLYRDYEKNHRSNSRLPFFFKFGQDFTREEKIAFMDKYVSLTDRDMDRFKNAASYMAALNEKYAAEKDSLKKDSFGLPHTNSRKAWIRKNDTQNLVDNNYHIGTYRMFGYKDYVLGNTTTYSDIYGRTVDIVDEWFYNFLIELERKEKNYFIDTDPIAQGILKLRDLGSKYGCFGNSRLSSIVDNGLSYIDKSWLEWTKYTPVDMAEVDTFLALYDKLEAFNKAIEDEANSSLCIHNDFNKDSDYCNNF